MATGRRERDIKLLVAKFVKLVESLNPGERLTIKKVAARKPAAARNQPKAQVRKAATKGEKARAKGAGKTSSVKAS